MRHSLGVFILLLGILGLIGCNGKQDILEVEQIDPYSDVEEVFPSKPIQLVVPYAPGGGTDTVARAFAQTANKYFEQPVIVVNKLGQGGARGLKEGLFSEKDGYTVTLVTTEINTLSVFGLIDFSYKDMEPLLLLNTEPGVLVASIDFPFDSIEEVINEYNQTGKKFTIGSAGKGSIWGLAAKGIEAEANIEFEYKYYDGTSIAIVEGLGGNIDLVIGSISEAKTHLDQKQLKVLTVFSKDRIEEFKDIKTFSESGFSFNSDTWRGLAIPKDVDQEIVDYLITGFTKAAKDKDFIDMMDKLNLRYDFEEQEVFIQHIEDNYMFYDEFKSKLDSLD